MKPPQKMFLVSVDVAIEVVRDQSERETKQLADMNDLLSKGWQVVRVDQAPGANFPQALVTIEAPYSARPGA